MNAPNPQNDKTTGHEWDGIHELDNPLPRWWLWTFYASILVAAVMWVLMPAWPGIRGYTKGLLHLSDRAQLGRSLSDLQKTRGAEAARLRDASLQEIEADPDMQAYALSVGQSIFGDNCATCHGVDGLGRKGYANLRDDVWLWGGAPEDILHTITVGVRQGAPDRSTMMPAFGRMQILSAGQIHDVTEYIVRISGRPADVNAVDRGGAIFAAQCGFCHGADGKGDVSKGAPDLTDGDWLYGSDRASISDQVFQGRGGTMPAWNRRYDAPTLKALAVYVHANAGGR